MILRILVADDHALTRTGVRNTLEDEPGFQVVAESENGLEAVQMTAKYRPDIVIMDVTMPKMNGLEAACKILQNDPQAKILILSMHADKRFVEQALKMGVSGYLLKDCAITEVVGAVKNIYAGLGYLSPAITGIVLEDYRKCGHPEQPLCSSQHLTPAEREVLQLVAEGKTSKEIASALFISQKTVEARRGQIMEKLDLHTVAELTKYAVREGLTSLES